MSHTDFLRLPTTGLTLYARPFAVGAWSITGKIDGDDAEEPGKYVFLALDDDTDYEVFVQAGEEPEEGDLAVGVLPKLVTVSSGGGEGVYSLAVTVKRSTDSTVVQGAQVAITGSGYSQTTPTGGVVTFNGNAGNFSLICIPPTGFLTPDPVPFNWPADSVKEIILTPLNISPPSDPTASTVAVRCVDENLANEQDVKVTLKIIKAPAGTGLGLTSKHQVAISGNDGIAQLIAPKNSTCQIRRGSNPNWTQVEIGSDGVTYVDNFIGD